MSYRIKNWATYQHYSDKRAPWIKLYPDVATDYEFRSLPERVQLRLIFLWMTGPRFKNTKTDEPLLPDKPAALSLAASIDITIKDLDAMVSSGFLIRETDSRERLDSGYGEGEGEGEREGEKRQKRPSVDEVNSYIQKMGYRGFTGQQFIDHYTANGWRVGRNPMKDWMAAVRTWSSRNKVGPKHDNLTGSSSNPDRPCQYCGKPYPCKCYEGE